MRHETFDLSSYEDSIAEAAIRELAGIAGSFDACFLPVGEALLQLVETVDAVVRGLDDIRTAFSDGRVDVAVTDLTRATRCLIETPATQERRRGCLAELAGKVSKLSSLSNDLDRVLYVLQFYSLNIKIAAAGAAEFVDFADEMNKQLAQGRQELAGFAGMVGQLLQQLASMSTVDLKLSTECKKLIPAVPDRLTDAASRLTGQQQKVVAVVEAAGRVAAAIRGHIGRALGSIQIGDSTRQRIEHVAFACEMIAGIAHSDAPADREAAGHLAALSVAQLEATETDFASDAHALLKTLVDLLPDTSRLLDSIRQEQSVQSSNALIASLEAGIADSVALTGHLEQANRDLAAILASVIATIASLTARVERVRDLGIEVGYMSVNANLRCRRDPAISKPVAVIAREIKSHSRLIDSLSSDFVSIAASLTAISEDISAMDAAGRINVEDMLTSSLESLSVVAASTSTGMAKVAVECGDLISRLDGTTQNLRQSIAVAGRVTSVRDELGLIASPMAAGATCEAAHPLPAMLARLHATYSMVQERTVHARFAIGEPGEVAAIASSPPINDDDAFF